MPKAKKALATPPRAWRKPDISFSLVNLKVGIGSIQKDEKVEGHKYDPVTSLRVKQQWVSEDGTTIPEVATGYETEKGVVFLDDTDQEAIKVGTTGVIDLVGFCDAATIDALYPDASYNIWPDGAGHTRAFGALAEALHRTGKAGVGTCAFTNCTRLVVVRWDSLINHLLLQTCNFESTIQWDKIEQARRFAKEGGPQPAEAEVELACEIVTSSKMHVDFNEFAASITDDYQAALAKAIEAKAAGKKVKTAKVEEVSEPVDLIEALRASVAQASKPTKARKKVKASR